MHSERRGYKAQGLVDERDDHVRAIHTSVDEVHQTPANIGFSMSDSPAESLALSELEAGWERDYSSQYLCFKHCILTPQYPLCYTSLLT